MALLFCDSFDHYTTAEIPYKWSNALGNTSIQATIKRNGSSAMELTQPNSGAPIYQTYNILNNASSLFAGFAIYFNQGLSQYADFCAFGLTGSVQITLKVNSVGAISVYRSTNVLLGTTANSVLGMSAFYYVEVGVTFSTSTTGTVTVKVNGATVLTLTGVQTANTTAAANQFSFVQGNSNGSGSAEYFDDLYLCDNTGSYANTFLGDIKVVCLTPTANGRINNWLANGAASNYLCVDTVPAATTDYVSDATPGDIDDYALSALPAGTPLAVQVVAYAEKDDSGTRTLGLGVGNGTTEVFDAGHPLLQNTYGFFTNPLSNNPLTNAAWAFADFTTLQASIKEIA